MRYFEDQGTSYVEQQGRSNPFDGVDVGSNGAPAFLDYDRDGDKDLIVGNGVGKLEYFERTGDSSFDEQTGVKNPFDEIDVGTDSTPVVVDYDGDGDLDVVVGNQDGALKYYQNNGNGDYIEQAGASNPSQNAFAGYRSH